MTINTGIDIRGGERSDTYNKPVRARTSFLSIEGLSKMRPTPATSDMSSRSLQSPGLRTPSFYKHENTNVVRKMHCHVPRRPVQKKNQRTKRCFTSSSSVPLSFIAASRLRGTPDSSD